MHLADKRCQLNDELITAWQYRDTDQPVLPLLLRRAAGNVGKIEPALLFDFKLSRWWLIAGAVVILLLLWGNWYFYQHPLSLVSSLETIQPAGASKLNELTEQMEKTGKG